MSFLISEFPYQETLTNMDALQLLQLIQIRSLVKLPILVRIIFQTSETHLTIQSEFP